MRKYFQDHNISWVIVSSAGTVAHPEPPFAETVARLKYYGCDPSNHHQTKLTEEVLQDKDLVICMAEHHRIRVREFGFDAVLFNELAYGKSEDLMDDTEYGEKYWYDYDLWKYVDTIVDYIHDAMPYIVKNILK